jgi:hypothetical protein
VQENRRLISSIPPLLPLGVVAEAEHQRPADLEDLTISDRPLAIQIRRWQTEVSADGERMEPGTLSAVESHRRLGESVSGSAFARLKRLDAVLAKDFDDIANAGIEAALEVGGIG